MLHSKRATQAPQPQRISNVQEMLNIIKQSQSNIGTTETQEQPYETTEECNEKRNYLIKAVKDFLGINFSDAHVLAVLYRQYFSDASKLNIIYQQYFVERGTNHVRLNTVANYIKKEHQNILFERIVFNQYARYHGIRYEDSVEIIQKFISTINL